MIDREALRAALRIPNRFTVKFAGGHKPPRWAIINIETGATVFVGMYLETMEGAKQLNENARIDAILKEVQR